MASFAELSAHTGWTYKQAVEQTEGLGIPPVIGGWDRKGLTDHELIPALPAYTPTFVASPRYTYRRLRKPTACK